MIVQTHYFNNGNDLSESKVNALGVAITRLLGRAPHKSFQINSPIVTSRAGNNREIDQLSIFPIPLPNRLGTKDRKGESAVNMVVELRLIRIQHPYLNSSILAQYLALNAGKYNFTRMQKRVFKKAPTFDLNDISLNKEGLPQGSSAAQLFSPTSWETTHAVGLTTGVKLELAGRLTTQRSIPRKTVENKHTGSFTVDHRISSGPLGSASSVGAGDLRSPAPAGAYSPGSLGKEQPQNPFVNLSQYTSKNKLGTYTIKV